MKKLIIITVAALLLLAACGQKNTQTTCPTEAQQCPDGSYVLQVPPTCKFAECPPPDHTTTTNITPVLNITEPEINVTPTNTTEMGECNYNASDRTYIQHSTEACSRIRYACTQGKEYFSDACGCGCKTATESEETVSTQGCDYNDTTTRYVQRDAQACKSVLLNCMTSEQNFTNSCGCGCAKMNATIEPANITYNNSKPVNTTFAQFQTCTKRDSDYCSANYEPVCGWYNETIKCIKYPCAQTYSNACIACRDKQVTNWTNGECPTKFDTNRGY